MELKGHITQEYCLQNPNILLRWQGPEYKVFKSVVIFHLKHSLYYLCFGFVWRSVVYLSILWELKLFSLHCLHRFYTAYIYIFNAAPNVTLYATSSAYLHSSTTCREPTLKVSSIMSRTLSVVIGCTYLIRKILLTSEKLIRDYAQIMVNILIYTCKVLYV